MNINPTWTDARIERMTVLWHEGKSATEIAIIIGGLSRNAVVGKLNRLGLKRAVKNRPAASIGRPRPGKSPKDVCETEKPRPAAVETPRPVVSSVIKPEPLNFSLFDLAQNDCRFPVSGEKAGTLFCGHNVAQGSTYCTYHARVAYIPREVRLSKKRAA